MGVPRLACQIPPLWSLTLNSKLWGFANNAVIAVRAEGGTVFVHINTISSQIILFLLLSLSLWRAHDVSRWQSEFPWNCCSQETRSRSQTTMWVQFCSAHTGGLFFFFSMIWKIQFPWTEDCVAANHSSGWPVEAVDSHVSPSALSHKATSSHCRVRSFNRRRQKLALQLLLKMFFVFLFFFLQKTSSKKVILIQYLCNIGMIIELDVSLSSWTTICKPCKHWTPLYCSSVCVSLCLVGTKTTWLVLGKDHVLAKNTWFCHNN